MIDSSRIHTFHFILFSTGCPEKCKTNATCEANERGLHADVRYFHLTKINIPDDVETRYMEALVLQETTLRAKLIQQGNLIRKETTGLVSQCWIDVEM